MQKSNDFCFLKEHTCYNDEIQKPVCAIPCPESVRQIRIASRVITAT